MNEETLFKVVTENDQLVFTNCDDFYDFMSENNGRPIVSIEKCED